MAHTDKDQPYKFTGKWTHKYWISPKNHGAFTKAIRRTVRSRAKQELRSGREPQPRYPDEKAYFD